nr:hypothetical protein [uncultured Bacteroides sp.]
MKIYDLRHIWYYFIIFLLFSCTGNRYAADIEDVLALAGDNRSQLEQVLKHYSRNPEDSLKLRAAEFLIRNMPGKCTETYDASWEDVAAALYRWSDTPDKGKLSETYGLGEMKVREDVHYITAEYLINNIELAFQMWRGQPWGKHIAFNRFCEEILPYRVGKEPLENWRGKVLASFGDLNAYFEEHSEITAVEACCKVNQQLPRFTWVGYPIPGMSYSMLMSTPRGSCDEMGALAIFAMRALGIPVTRDFTLQWPNRNLGHSWNAVCDSAGRHISFMGAESNPGETHIGTRLKKSKVYRATFARQSRIIDTEGEEIPMELQNRYMVDVSNEYEGCTFDVDLPADFSPVEGKEGNVYLLSLGKDASSIVDYGRMVNGRLFFKNIGKRILYLPVYYEDGKRIPAGYPFRLDDEGNLSVFKPDMENRRSVVVADMGLNQSMLFRMQGGVFEGADKCDFSDKKLLYAIEEMPTVTYQKVRVPDMNPYRYVRYVSPKGGNGNVAEIEFYGNDGKKLKGRNIGTPGSWYNSSMTCDKVFDGDIYTYFDAAQGEGDYAWTGLDLGSPQSICEIRYFPRIEDCRIVEGRTYELYYRTREDWKVLERKKAVKASLDYLVPDNGLFYLRDAETDVESCRFFMVKDGKQVWL